MSEQPLARDRGRSRKPVQWSTVLGILVVTCLGMLYAIHWVVKSAQH